MPASPFFARIRGHVLQLTAAVPAGKVCTFQSMGAYLDVMPRHVAYILSQLDDDGKLAYPWYRVVGGDGSLGSLKVHPDGTAQAELLRAEGLCVTGNRVGPGFESVFLPAEQLASGVPRQRRPADAPAPRPRRSPPARKR